MSQQEQRRLGFEAWVRGRKVCTRYGAKVEWNAAGQCYRDYRINDRWVAWNAALDSIEIKLPSDEELMSGSDNPIWVRDQCKEVIEEAGLKVKP